MKNNSIVIAGDRNYFWGLFLLIASLRKNKMDEPVVVAAIDFPQEYIELLEQFDHVKVHRMPYPARTISCSKGEYMLLADTEYITWVDCDAFFIGNNSENLIPNKPNQIHIRQREQKENALAFKGHYFGENGQKIPEEVLRVWRKDCEVAPHTPANIEHSCSACLCSIHKSSRHLMEAWGKQIDKVLPRGDVGVINQSDKYYHQLDESVLNSLLCFMPNAPTITENFRLDKDPQRLFIHFVTHPKPWVAWGNATLKHFDQYVALVDYLKENNYKFPQAGIPFSLQKSNKKLATILAPYFSLSNKIMRKLKSIFK